MMKKIIEYIYVLGIVVLMTASCSDKNKVTVEPSVSISGQSEYVVETKGGTISVNFTSTKEWSATSGQSWCKITPTSGEGGSVLLSITIEENTSFDQRNAAVTITSETVSKKITVTQKQKDALTLTSSKQEVPYNGGNISIEVKSNVDYTYEIEESAKGWIKPVGTKAMTTSNIQLSVSENDSFDKREGKITIKSGDLVETYTVYQDGAVPSIVLSQNEYAVQSGGETITIQLKSNVEYQMIMPKDADWLSVAETKAMSDYTHYIVVAPNETYDSREAEILFVNEEDGISEPVKIVQMQKNAIVVAENYYELESAAQELVFNVNSNIEFEVSVSADWIHYQPQTKAMTEHQLSFLVDEHIGLPEREGEITISGEGLTQVITIYQKCRTDKSLFAIRHRSVNFAAPVFTGHALWGYIYWGDDDSEDYKDNLVHVYARPGEYSVQVEVYGAEEVFIPTIKDVIEIDLSEF